METYSYILSGTLLVGIIGYFLKREHNSVRSDIRELYEDRKGLSDRMVKLEGKVENIESKVPSEIANLERIMDLKLSSFDEKISNIQRSVDHMDKTITSMSETFLKLLEANK